MTDAVDQAVTCIRGWGEARDWRGYDPYDALNSPLAPVLTLGTRSGRRAVTQAVKLFPLNLRPLLGIQPEWNAKAIGLVASAYARLAAAGDATASAEAERWLDWLVCNHSGDEAGLAWGYPFDVQTRICFYDRGTPNTIATSFAAHALLDASEFLNQEQWVDAASRAARFLREHLLTDGAHGPYFRYVELEPELIHNANLLACSVLVRVGHAIGDDSLLQEASRALHTTLAAQREDGSWPYGSASYLTWVDNFHTAYVLECLVECAQHLPEIRPALARGVAFWESELFLPDGTPKYYSDRVGPLDAHNVTSAIDAWLALMNFRPDALAQAERLAELLVARLLHASGFVCFQQRKLWTSRVPFVRWTTAPSFRALAGILLARIRAASRRIEPAHALLD